MLPFQKHPIRLSVHSLISQTLATEFMCTVIPGLYFYTCIDIMMVGNCHCDHFFSHLFKMYLLSCLCIIKFACKQKAVEWQNYFRNIRSAKSYGDHWIYTFFSCCFCHCFFLISRPIYFSVPFYTSYSLRLEEKKSFILTPKVIWAAYQIFQTSAPFPRSKTTRFLCL